tara:strand:- start:24954 stop:25280 length:327 start_codon:yes stop_codon:yes gene_type:complete
MKQIVLNEQVDAIINQSFWRHANLDVTASEKPTTQIKEDAKPEVAEVEKVGEAAHTCPLCESKLEAPISDEKIQEHMDLVAQILMEMEEVTDEELDGIAEVADGSQSA